MVILTEDSNDLLYQKLYLSSGILLLLVSHYQCSYVYHRLEDCRLVPVDCPGRDPNWLFFRKFLQDNLKADGGRLARVF